MDPLHHLRHIIGPDWPVDPADKSLALEIDWTDEKDIAKWEKARPDFFDRLHEQIHKGTYDQIEELLAENESK